MCDYFYEIGEIIAIVKLCIYSMMISKCLIRTCSIIYQIRNAEKTCMNRIMDKIAYVMYLI